MAEKTKKQAEEKNNSQEQTQELVYEKNKSYSIEEAVELVKKTSKVKFDASVEVHFKLGIDPKKGDQQIRSAVTLPHGTGKTIKVAAFVESDKEKEVKEAGADIVGGEELVEKIKTSEETDFDVAVAQTSMMKKITSIAKILGTRGLMPSPKNDTVTDNPAQAVIELKKGKVSFKNDNTANIHAIIGKVSFDSDKIKDNFNTLLTAIKKAKPTGSKGQYIKNISICSSMGPGIKVTLE
jgi:large subunit ribosomal protein L1